MGREIYCKLYDRKNNNVLFEDADLYVCGRDACTNYLAELAYKNTKTEEDCPYISVSLDAENVKDGDILFADLCEKIQKYADADWREIDKVAAYRDDAREARKQANFEDFRKFSGLIAEAEEWLEENSWSRADAVRDMLNQLAVKRSELQWSDSDISDDVVILLYVDE